MEQVPAISGRWPTAGWFVNYFIEVCFSEEQYGFLPTSTLSLLANASTENLIRLTYCRSCLEGEN
jgi:hypothetical protein